METEYFDLALEGTCLCDLFKAKSSAKIVVIDKSGHYGSTFSDIESLKTSNYISSLKILKDKRKPALKVSIEAFPMFLGSGEKFIENFGQNAFGSHLEFVDLKDIYFMLNDRRVRIPTNKNDIDKLEISKSDLFYFYKSIKENNLEILKNNFSDKSNLLYKALIEYKIFDNFSFEKLSKSFGKSPFIYPLHGLSEISECSSLNNSFKGVTYVLNTDLKHTEINENDYKHKFSCELGCILAKEYKKRVFKDKKQYIRLIMIEKKKFTGNFIAFLGRPKEFEIGSDNAKDFTKVIGLTSEAEICPEEHQVLYFIREKDEVDQIDLKAMNIQENDVIFDISYISKYDFSP